MGDRRVGRLRVIDGGAGKPEQAMSFCGHCGSTPARRTPEGELPRLCERCSIGVILEAQADAVPRRQPFLVVDATLKIIAVSDRAEELLQVYEHDARGRPVTEFLLGRDSAAESFAVAIADSFTSERILRASARLRHRPTVSVSLRIACCTAPRASLVVFTRAVDDGRRLAIARSDATS